MAVSRALRRLLRIRDLEEEQCRLALESALGELHRMEHTLAAATERHRRGRTLLVASAESGLLTDRLASLEEMRSAGSHAAALEPRIDAMGAEVTQLREEFLSKRVERRQAETLIQESEAREAVETGRRGQQSLDDWYSARQYRDASQEAKAKPGLSAAEELVFQADAAQEQALGE